MGVNKIIYKGYQINYYYRDDLLDLAKKIIDGDILEVNSEYRNSDRAVVRSIMYNDEKLILKESKNERKTIKKMISYFSKGEALITLINVNSFLDKNVFLYRPYVSIQKRNLGVIVKSYLITNFISNEEARNPEYFRNVCETINILHKNKKSHGDAKLDNFLIDENGNVVVIDTRLRGMGFLNVRKYYDYLNIKYDIKNADEYMRISKTPVYYFAFFVINFKKTKLFLKIRKLRKRKYNKSWERVEIMKEIKNILVIRIRRLGDSILSEAVCETLRSSFPDANIDYLLNSGLEELFLNNPNIDNILSIDEKENKSLFKYIKKVINIVFSKKYDIIIDVRSTPKTYLFSIFSFFRTKYRIGKKKKFRRLFYTHVTNDVEYRKGSIVGMHLSYLKPLEKEYNIKYLRDFKVYLSKEEIEKSKDYMRSKNIDFNKKRIMLSVNARVKNKKWPAEKFKQVVNDIASKYDVQFIYYYDKSEKNETIEIAEYIGLNNISFYNLETNTLRELASLISNCDFFFGNEGGPRHISQALQIPSFAIYPPSANKQEWLPSNVFRYQGIEAEDINRSYSNIKDYEEKFSKISVRDVENLLFPMLDMYI